MSFTLLKSRYRAHSIGLLSWAGRSSSQTESEDEDVATSSSRSRSIDTSDDNVAEEAQLSELLNSCSRKSSTTDCLLTDLDVHMTPTSAISRETFLTTMGNSSSMSQNFSSTTRSVDLALTSSGSATNKKQLSQTEKTENARKKYEVEKTEKMGTTKPERDNTIELESPNAFVMPFNILENADGVTIVQEETK